MTVEVQTYSGYKADERPLRFRVRGGEWREVVEVADRWYDPDAIYFRARADDGSFYVLRHREGTGEWTLEAFRRGET